MIPKLHYIAEGNSSEEIIENIQKACSSGIELVRLSLENVFKSKSLALAKKAREITSYFQTRLIIEDNYKIAKDVKADGVHFTKLNADFTKARIHLYNWQIIGATANTLQESEILVDNNIDYITLSPFRNSKLDQDIKTLGLNGFSLITEALKTETPILGEGEITVEDIPSILKTGISGVAISEAISANFDSIKEFHQLLKASSIDEKRHTF
ncbi:thiamine phosphate synthase [Polaribacter pectinis]|uniref:Thiamine phosphate synthase n=1 Tax=Polaribacter pectinis TaxID=2738844 RepID=A0A7G9LCM2_9FLAO|nr:thiamine phosphate synthase [Polaribacter pectinis]QNM86371.1 thiamine phosphate synthase [Polaribacter pectinis]